jgi:aminopeptidase
VTAAAADVAGPDPAAFADLLCEYCLDVSEGQQVLIRSTPLAAPLLLELQRAVLQRGAWPLLRISLPGEERGFYAHAAGEPLDAVAPIALAEARRADASLRIQAPADTRALADVDPALIARASRARRPLGEAVMRRRWCISLWPTPALAEQAGLPLTEYEALVCRALFLDRPEPAHAWRGLHEFQAGLIERLSQARKLRLEGPDTDVTVSVRGRTWVNSDGRRNMPSGEVFTGPLESSAEGRISFNVSASPGGVEVAGVRLTFRRGEVVEAHAERGQDYLREMLASDPGARRLGEIGIATNYGIDRPTGTILFDEKIGGTFHLALGRSYAETGGRNRSALHWDMICDLRGGGTISADGEVIQRDGRFVGR